MLQISQVKVWKVWKNNPLLDIWGTIAQKENCAELMQQVTTRAAPWYVSYKEVNVNELFLGSQKCDLAHSLQD